MDLVRRYYHSNLSHQQVVSSSVSDTLFVPKSNWDNMVIGRWYWCNDYVFGHARYIDILDSGIIILCIRSIGLECFYDEVEWRDRIIDSILSV